VTYSLYDYQKKGVAFAKEAKYSLIGDEMGLGKSLQAIQMIKDLGLNAVIFCPKFLVETWLGELEKFDAPNKISIVPYSQMKKRLTSYHAIDIFICDEIHYLKNITAKRTQFFHELLFTHRPKYFLGLSGTAIKNRVSEFYSLLLLLSYGKGSNGKDITKLCPNFYSFCNRFSNKITMSIGGRRIIKYEGHKNIEELKTYLDGKYLRRKAKDVLELPDLIRKDVLFEIKEDKELKSAFDSGEKSTHFTTLKMESAISKVPYTLKYVGILMEEGGPLLIYSDHIIPVEKLFDSLQSSYRVSKITGSVKNRFEIVRDFQDGKIDILVTTIGSLGMGVTLTASRNIIFNDLSWVSGDNSQAEKRIHRIGAKEKCVIHRMISGKIDKHIVRTLTKKINTLEKIL